jgi:hypothetical protein
MNLKSVKLDHDSYEEYIQGKEIHCEAGKLTTKNIEVGEHVLVYRDTTAANTDAPVPKREMQSEYIGIEGVITNVFKSSEHHEGVTIRKV